jgi:hypothetical protein
MEISINILHIYIDIESFCHVKTLKIDQVFN